MAGGSCSSLPCPTIGGGSIAGGIRGGSVAGGMVAAGQYPMQDAFLGGGLMADNRSASLPYPMTQYLPGRAGLMAGAGGNAAPYNHAIASQGRVASSVSLTPYQPTQPTYIGGGSIPGGMGDAGQYPRQAGGE
jgi:hypothetical protein